MTDFKNIYIYVQLQNPHLWGVKFDQKTHKSPPLPGRGRVGLDIDRCINTEEMGKTQFYASFVNSIVAILSQRLVIQGHYNDTLPDRSKCYKNNRGRFYRDLVIKASAALFTISFALEVYTGRTDR